MQLSPFPPHAKPNERAGRHATATGALEAVAKTATGLLLRGRDAIASASFENPDERRSI